jgi:cell division protein FtsB
MAHILKLRQLFLSAMGPAFAIILLALFAFYAVFGPSGIMAWGDYSRQLSQRQVELAAITRQRAELRNRVDRLDPRHVDPDLVDELLHRELGVAHPNEVILPIN